MTSVIITYPTDTACLEALSVFWFFDWMNEYIQGFQGTDQEYEYQLGSHENCWTSMRSFAKYGYNEKDQCKYHPFNTANDDITNPDIYK